MGCKRSRATLRPSWHPDAEAADVAICLCAAVNGAECPFDACLGAEGFRDRMAKGHYLAYYTGNSAPTGVLDDVFDLTKRNMASLYDAADFLGGWKDRMKYRELSASKTHIIALSDDNGGLAGFVSYRFLIIADCQAPTEVCYIYELQVDAGCRSRGVGRFLMSVAESIGRRVGARKLMCTVLKLNPRAVSFYRSKCGFVDDESDPSSVDFERRAEHAYHILKLELGASPRTSPTDGTVRSYGECAT
ncbi:N-alpha-acetyltransferase 40 [Babesia caballi]|uniref:N-alpha-acetyltransferase 40 n=1 Tax=Babesia caballi TaxID=5871 RepID=A0AAV4LQA3_BABCB|nr:N-alpha-acetyltransferase 40 [Babesia caballi]